MSWTAMDLEHMNSAVEWIVDHNNGNIQKSKQFWKNSTPHLTSAVHEIKVPDAWRQEENKIVSVDKPHQFILVEFTENT